jgi:hypothetical protein
MIKNYFLLFLTFICIPAFAQNTVGILTNDPNSYNGYTLFSPFNSNETYLINNCGEVVNQWTSTSSPGASQYLLENGNLLRTGKIINDDITFGGVGGKIELFDWENNLIWEYTYSSSQFAQHHDIYPLPNGNILMLAVSTINETEAIQAGRDPSLITEGKIYNEQILELEPVGTNQANIVWEWNIKDHLVQDFDATKDNYGVIAENPQLLDFNYINADEGEANWLHINSLQYNETLDQILISSRILSEIYIIDHSTTTLEAGSHNGGLYGKGGDFLYRWGNPEAYDKGDSMDRKLFSQHYPHWIPGGLIDAGKILIFNNGNAVRYSSVDIIEPPSISPGLYSYDPINGYGPTTANWSYTDPVDPANFFAFFMSSAQRLPNGNTLICEGDTGYFFEIDPSNNKVWEYINPDTPVGILAQGESESYNPVFRAIKFSLDYPAFTGKDLTPGPPIEINPDLSDCNLLGVNEFNLNGLTLYPNPVKDILNVDYKNPVSKIEVYTILGNLVQSVQNSNQIDLTNLTTGIYIAKIKSINREITKRIIKQ